MAEGGGGGGGMLLGHIFPGFLILFRTLSSWLELFVMLRLRMICL